MTGAPERTSALRRLLRWEAAGGTWVVTTLTASQASVALCTCDGGEQVEAVTSSDPELLAFLAAREASGDAPI